ncbi:aminopeptidase N [Nitrospirillum iridis]|uniref:Aminopeptidase N n=1 Tax=Nitrospirillum iridis TaxID=765888 RepID=A0A7X0B1E4_9PROT|nr:aminopeptidase N [Nitrospirillum iridis]MBB6253998.1 aminopeptidase N [Nitrospirillum iridis]
MDSRQDTATPHAIHLRDHTPPAWLIDTVDLHVDLREEAATVRATLAVRRNPNAQGPNAQGPNTPGPNTQGPATALVLDGQELELLAVRVDNRLLGPDDYTLTPDRLTLTGLPDAATVEITTRTRPQDNTALEGLYKSSGNYCTQCEAEGFRKITYFLDRPDVMARYTTTIEAEQARYPVLLSNGNLTASGASATEPGRHWARWEDPWPKPCYLFALVAGSLVHIEDRFTTRSGRAVTLRIYVEPGNEAKCGHAMESLKKSMKWDEDVYGLEYDLDIFNIVAVSDFNMGAMENKSLNVFNTKYILAQPETATDTDFLGIETVVAHEYFHNWTGNRVTCRDWFQLSLKEGLTVFRDQEFSADMNSAPVKRIQDVQRLRQVQFIEDSGPTAHSVRPESYIEISNFYTPTVYEKGAEVLRLYRTLLGAAGYRKGIDLYFARHDGQAVTTDDFLAALVEANGAQVTDPLWAQFQRWYTQAGTPTVSGEGRHDAATGTYALTLRQTVPATPGQPDKLPMVIPVTLGLVGPDGRDLPLTLEGEPEGATGAGATTRTLALTAAEQTFRFTGVAQPPVPSLLRGFSAPVRLAFTQDDAALTFLMAHDSDPFNRWEAGQTLATRLILADVDARAQGGTAAPPQAYIDATAQTLARGGEDRAFAALALALPTEAYLGQQRPLVDVDGIHAARQALRRALATALNGAFLKTYDGNRTDGAFTITPEAMGRRALKNAALAYLMALDDAPARALCLAQYQGAATMTDAIAALALIADSDMAERADCLAHFADRWKGEALVMDKWFAVQALSDRPDTLERVRALLDHPSFSIRNPNKVYALVGSFAANPSKFHAADGAGYAFLADTVLTLDKLNPQVASRMVKPLARWRPYDSIRQQHARAALERIVGTAGLSRDVYEIASKSLAG